MSHAMTQEAPASAGHGSLRMLWAELGMECQLECLHCYAGSGPKKGFGTMTAADWERVLHEAAVLGTRHVTFIGGEPTLSPALPQLTQLALSLGMTVEVYSNLVHVTPALWELFSQPGVSLAASWYTSDREKHKAITGGRDTWRQTRANLAEAVRRGIPVRAGIVDGIVDGQDVIAAEAELREMGVSVNGADFLRQFGRGTSPDPSQACGNCGNQRAAVLPDGSVTPCPLTRWMTAGSVHDSPLADLAPVVSEKSLEIPARAARARLTPCGPDRPCIPTTACKPECSPYSPRGVEACGPTCTPGECVPSMGDCRPLCSPSSGCSPHPAQVTACRPDPCSPTGGDEPCRPECEPTSGPCKPWSAMDEASLITASCPPDEPCAPELLPCRPECSPSGHRVQEASACTPQCMPDLPPCAPELRPCRPDQELSAPEARDCRPADPGCKPSQCGPDLVCRPTKKQEVQACWPGVPCWPDTPCNPGSSPCEPHRAVSEASAKCVPGTCQPDDCRPDKPCSPKCAPGPLAEATGTTTACNPQPCSPDCNPDMRCEPMCGPGPCTPHFTHEAAARACRPDYDPCAPELLPCSPDCGPSNGCSPDRQTGYRRGMKARTP